MLPHWDTATLTMYSDLVVVGTMRSGHTVAVLEVLKGELKAKEITVADLGGFADEDPLFRAEQKVTLGARVVLFLSQRDHLVRVVGNGVYRAGKVDSKEGVLGYFQANNPGGYSLLPEIQFKDIAAVKALIQGGLRAIPARQQAALERVKAAKTARDFCQALDELERITRIGDTDILRQIAALDVDGKTRGVMTITYFIRNVSDKRGAALLQKLYDKHRNEYILTDLGRLGDPESLPYLASLIDNKGVTRAIYALYGMKELYLALEAEGDERACNMVRDAIYRYVDQDLMGLMMSAPDLINVIPHQGSLDRLRRAYEYHVKQRTGAEHDLPRSIQSCEEKIKELNKRAPGKSLGETPR